MLVLLALCSAVSPVRATTVWSDNFNDGNYNDWTVHRGGYSAASLRLVHTTGLQVGISHPSTVAVGTWRFDMHVDTGPGQYGDFAVSFMAGEIQPGSAEYPPFPAEGYCVSVHLGKIAVGIWSMYEYSILPGGTGPSLDETSPGQINVTMHIDITRTSAGDINVWMDNTHVIQCRSTAVTTSSHFAVGERYYQLAWIDNIVVSNTVDLEPPTTPTTPTTPTDAPPPIPGFTVPAITVGLLVALATAIIYRRRKR